MSIILGIDPGPSLAESHCALLDTVPAPRFFMSGAYVGIHRGEYPLSTVPRVQIGGLPTNNIMHHVDVAIIEWIAESAGIYMRKGEPRPSRARAGKVLQTHSAATSIRDALHNAGVAVYCVPRREILRQAGCQQADFAVTDWLEMHGFIQVSAYDRRVNLHKTAEQIALGGDNPFDLAPCKRVTTPGLTTTHSRDALMAALFNTRDPRNAKYKYNP